MTLTKFPAVKTRRKPPNNLLFERIMALLATANYLLVLFDLTYIPLRNFWLQGRVQGFIKLGNLEWTIPKEPLILPRPDITNLYDLVKGIEPNQDTEAYLNRVDELESAVVGKPLESPEIEAILGDLRRQSVEMIDTNPFQVANKTGTLEKIKNTMRDRVFGTEQSSSKAAFQQFWSFDNLNNQSYGEEIAFFNREIRPLMETNYYRPIGENGEPINNFGLIDFLGFSWIFALEFLGRTWFISRHRTGVSWIDAMTWRWYDLFFLIPVLRWLRIIPVVIRLNQAHLIDLHKIQRQASQGFVAGIAEDVTEVVVVNVLNQAQAAIHQGDIAKFLSESTRKTYIDLNDINETAEIVKLLLQLTVNQVLPTIKPDLEALLQYSIGKAISDVPAYQGAKVLPGIETLKTNLSKQLAQGLYQALYEGAKGLTQTDPVFDELLQRLTDNLADSLSSEMQAQQSLEQLEYLLNALIEEVKINYVQRLSEEDIEALLDQTRALRQAKPS